MILLPGNGILEPVSNGSLIISKQNPDLVIIDIKMPQIDGLEVIRQTKAAGITCRFLILSGYDDFYIAQKAIRYGANGYFLKPLRLKNLRMSYLVNMLRFSQIIIWAYRLFW